MISALKGGGIGTLEKYFEQEVGGKGGEMGMGMLYNCFYLAHIACQGGVM